jgi:hypothetical protein
VSLDNAALLVPLFLFGFGALWRSSTLKADVVKNWGTRVDDAEVALDDRATRLLLVLQEEIGSVLGIGSSKSLPIGAVADPSVLADRADDFRRTLKRRRRLTFDYRFMRLLGPGLIVVSSVFLVGWALVAANDTELARGEGLRISGVVLLSITAGLGVLLALVYALLNNRLANAEVLGSEEVSAARTFR